MIKGFKEWLVEGAVAPVVVDKIETGLVIVDGLVKRGFSPKVAAAIAGNAWKESEFNPTAKSPTGEYLGLIQWGTAGSRREKLKKLPSWHTIETQLDFIKNEFTNPYYSRHLPAIEAADIKTAAKKVMTYYEGTSHGLETRQAAAEQIWQAWQAKNQEPDTAFDPGQIDKDLDSAGV